MTMIASMIVTSTTVNVTQGIQSPGRKYNSLRQSPGASLVPRGGMMTTFEFGITPSILM
jgi:hypothetical protein